MHKTICASGFLYHPITQQILLQQQHSPSSFTAPWTLFSSTYAENQDPDEIFKNKILQLLHIKITIVAMVYAYFSEKTNLHQIVLYSEVDKLQDFSPEDGRIFTWFSFKDVLKLPATKQTKHDIVVGQRVIQASERKNRGEHTLQ